MRGVERRYEQLKAFAPWLLSETLQRNYGWTNEPAWQDLLATTSFSFEVAKSHGAAWKVPATDERVG